MVACMSTTAFSIAYLSRLVQNLGFGRIHNVTLNPTVSHPDVPAGETVIMEVIDRSGQGLFFTASCFTIPGHGFIPYKYIEHADWAYLVKGRESDYKEYIVICFRDRPAITSHVGGRAAVGLTLLFMNIRRRIDIMQAN